MSTALEIWKLAETAGQPKVAFESRWRILAKDGAREIQVANQGVFDELVIDDWLHLEQMTENSWWMRVGDARISVVLDDGGNVEVALERDEY